MKGKPRLTNMVAIYNKATRLLDEGRVVDVVYLHRSLAHNASNFKEFSLFIKYFIAP